jgi:diaminohydroxyphosphoribosylaminopyrimidine deaminase/5-amino-6-(5-phosphoribosylamino)uracil reductase
MEEALQLARKVLGWVSPNPAVGAVIVNGEEIVGWGYTQPPGSAHAEIMALDDAGEKARGGILYVTLEPCCHQGRTPPCTMAIINAGITQVHMAMLDPNPLVNGKGKEELERAGIRVFVGDGMEEASRINEAFTKYITTGLPFVTVKYAMSLDGKIATRSGDSRWISNEDSRRHVHCLRGMSDAIMVGVNTLLHDDPQLTSRIEGMDGKVGIQPLRVIVDACGRTPSNARVFTEPGSTIVAVGERVGLDNKRALAEAGAEVLELPSKQEKVELEALLKSLGEREVTSVMVEGGATLLGSLFDAKLVDKVIVYVAPIVVGGENALSAVAGSGVDKITEAVNLKDIEVKTLANDVMISGYIRD